MKKQKLIFSLAGLLCVALLGVFLIGGKEALPDKEPLPQKETMPQEGKTILAAYEYQYANMSLELPEDWSYEIAGVTFEDVTLAGGLAFTKCTEEIGDDMWLMLIFKDVAGNYALESTLSKKLWNQYEPALMAMLESLGLGEGHLRESEAIARAKSACTISYERERAFFNYQNGSWQVRFYTTGVAGGDQTVWINADGEIKDNMPGE